MFHLIKPWAYIVVLSVGLTGCATYGNSIQKALTNIETGDLNAAEVDFKKAIPSSGKDSLLHYLELGALAQLKGEYQESNTLLEKAYRLAQQFATPSASSAILGLMTTPRNTIYRGADFERLLIHYLKSLNSLALAQSTFDYNQKIQYLEAARVESQRIILIQKQLDNDYGGYQYAMNQEQSVFKKLLAIFSVLLGNYIDIEEFRLREDAYAHYLTGVSFEINQEWDNARISYQKSARAYQNGYAEQYQLGDQMQYQAWFDTVRMMKKSGFSQSEWQATAAQQLTQSWRDKLTSIDQPGHTQLLLIEHKGLVPQKQEMSLELSVNPALKALQLRPYFITDTDASLGWFYMLYADKGLLGLVSAYLNTVRNYDPRWFTKTFFLGDLYEQVEELQLAEAIGYSHRITIPYYEPPVPMGQSELTLTTNSGSSGITENHSLLPASSPALMAIYEQVVRSPRDIQHALARSTLKAVMAYQVGKEGGEVALLATKLLIQLFDAAETRHWLTLPADIRISRHWLPAGDQSIRLESHLYSGQPVVRADTIRLQPNTVNVVSVHTLSPTAQYISAPHGEHNGGGSE